MIKENDRLQNTLILSGSGSGKTYPMLRPMIEQDIENGNGVTII